MFPELLRTELLANRFLMALSLVLNLFFMVLMGVLDELELAAFVHATSIAFYIHLFVMVGRHSDQKLTRMYAQLPVTVSQVFWACWLPVLLWLGMQFVLWIAFGALLDSQFEWSQVIGLVQRLLSMLVMIAVVSIGFDLWSCRQRRWFWFYGAVMITLLLTPALLDLQVNLELGQQGLHGVLMQLFSLSRTTSIAALVALFSALLIANLAVFKRNESYLG